jgi:hypothetical protein
MKWVPILVEPVIKINFKVYMISEVSWSGGSGEELGFFHDHMSLCEFFVQTFIVFRNNSESIA